jgi:hypothetical protein
VAFSHDDGGWIAEGATAEDEEGNDAAACDDGGRVAR